MMNNNNKKAERTKNYRMIMICVDLEKSYDKVNREMYKEMYWKKDGIRGSLAKAERLMYVNCEICVKVQGGISDWFQVQ